MSEDTRSEAVEETADNTSTTPDIVDDEDLDIVIERVAPRQTGCGGRAWVMFILLLAFVLIGIGLFIRAEQEKAAALAREQREAGYTTQAEMITGTLGKSAELADKGELDAALELINAAADKWATLAGEANGNRDIERAEEFAAKQADLKSAASEVEEYHKQVTELDSQIAELNKQREVVFGQVRDRIKNISGGAPTSAGAGAKAEATPQGELPATGQVEPQATEQSEPVAEEVAPVNPETGQ